MRRGVGGAFKSAVPGYLQRGIRREDPPAQPSPVLRRSEQRRGILTNLEILNGPMGWAVMGPSSREASPGCPVSNWKRGAYRGSGVAEQGRHLLFPRRDRLLHQQDGCGSVRSVARLARTRSDAGAGNVQRARWLHGRWSAPASLPHRPSPRCSPTTAYPLRRSRAIRATESSLRCVARGRKRRWVLGADQPKKARAGVLPRRGGRREGRCGNDHVDQLPKS